MYKCARDCSELLREMDSKRWTAEWQSRLAVIYFRWAEAYERGGRFKESDQYFREGRRCLEHCAIQKRWEENSINCNLLDARLVAANSALERNALTEAKRELRMMRFRLEERRKGSDLASREKQLLFWVYMGIGECEIRSERYKHSVRWFDNALEVYTGAIGLSIDSMSVVEASWKLAYALGESGRVREGLEASDDAIEMLRRSVVDEWEKVRVLTQILIWRIEMWARWGWGTGEVDMERLASVWSNYDRRKSCIGEQVGRLQIARFRLEKFAKISELFKEDCLRSILQGPWVRNVSVQLATEVNGIGTWTSRSRRNELMNLLRESYLCFHRNWFRYCLANNLDGVVAVIAAVQGRQLEEQIADEWSDGWSERPEVVEYRMKRMQARAGLYDLDYKEMISRSPPYSNVTIECLQNGLCGDAELVVILVDKMRMGVERFGGYVIRKNLAAEWVDLGDLGSVVDKIGEFEESFSRRSRVDLFVCESLEDSLKSSWRDIAEMMRAMLWRPLENALVGVERVVFVTQGRLHLLPVDAAMPDGLEVIAYPGLVYFLERRGLLELDPPRLKAGVDVGCCFFEEEEVRIVSIRESECSAIVDVVTGFGKVRVEREGLFEGVAACVDTLIIACHNAPVMDGNLTYRLEIGRNRFLTADCMRKTALFAKRVFASTCLSSVMEEDSDGNPMGLYTSFWLRGTDVVVGSIVSTAEDWAPVLAILVFQCMRNEKRPLEEALGVAKRRLRTGQWYEDTEKVLRVHVGDAWKSFLEWKLASDISGVIKEKNERFIRDIFLHYGENDRFMEWIAMAGTLDEFLEKYGKLDLNSGLRELVRAFASAVVEARLEEKIPPEPVLGSLLYGMRAFGETRLGTEC